MQAQIDITDKFTDPNFLAAVYEAIGKTAPEPIYDTDVADIWLLNLPHRSIASLNGIEHLTGLVQLLVHYNQLTELDISKNTALADLWVNDNNLTELDVSNNTALSRIFAQNNQLNELDVSQNIVLTYLWINDNNLTGLDISNNIALENLSVGANQLTELDVSNNIALENLSAGVNQLTELDVSNNIALTDLIVGANQLTELDVSNNTALSNLQVHSNQLTEFDVSANTALEYLFVSDNYLSEFDVSNNTALKILGVSGNYLISIAGLDELNLEQLYFEPQKPRKPNISESSVTITETSIKFPKLSDVEFSIDNGITWQDNPLFDDLEADTEYTFLIRFKAAATLSFLENQEMTLKTLEEEKPKIDITNAFTDPNFLAAVYGVIGKTAPEPIYEDDVSSIDYLDVSNRNIASLNGIEYFISLTNLEVNNNQLAELDVSNNLMLTTLSTENNYFASEDNIIGLENLSLDYFWFGYQKPRNPNIPENSATRTETSIKFPTLPEMEFSIDEGATWQDNPLFDGLEANTEYTFLIRFKLAAILDFLETQEMTLKTLENITDKFTDPNFLAAVYGVIGKTAPEPIYDTDVSEISLLNVNDKNISSLNGIEYLTALRYFYAQNNQLTEIDVSKNLALMWLYVENNQLTELDVSQNIALSELAISGNQLVELDISKNTDLKLLWIGDNQLTELDLSKNTALSWLRVSNNKLTALNVSNNTALTQFSADNNLLTALDASQNTALKSLDVRQNYFISENDIIGLENLNLEYYFLFDLQRPRVPSISESNATITNASIKFSIPELHDDVEFSINNGATWQSNPLFDDLEAGTEYTFLIRFKASAILGFFQEMTLKTKIDITDKFTDLNFLTAVYETINKTAPEPIYDTDVSGIIYLDANNKNIANLNGIEYFTTLTRLFVSDNKLTELDVSNNIALTTLHVYGNYFLSQSDIIGLEELNLEQFYFDSQKPRKPSVFESAVTITQTSIEFPVLSDVEFSIDNGASWQDNPLFDDLEADTEYTFLIRFKAAATLSFLENQEMTLRTLEEEKPKIDITDKFTDENFLAAVYEAINKTAPEPIYDTDVSSITYLNIHNRNIADLNGIEYFTALVELIASDNKLTELDVSKNIALEHLVVFNNCLSSVIGWSGDIGEQSGCKEDDNKIDITNSFTDPNFLAAVYEAINKTAPEPIYDADVSSIDYLNASNRNIASLNGIEYFVSLKYLDVHNNYFISENDIAGLEELNLEQFYFEPQKPRKPNISESDVAITEANVEFPTLSDVEFSIDNGATWQDNPFFDGFEANTEYTFLIRFKAAATLSFLETQEMTLKTLEEEKPKINIADKFTDPNFLAAVYEAINKTALEPIYDTDVFEINFLNVSDRNISSLNGIEYFAALTTLVVQNNQLTELDVSKNTALEQLFADNNYLSNVIGWNSDFGSQRKKDDNGDDKPNYIFSNSENRFIGAIAVQAKGNTIVLKNVPSNTRVEVYNTQGKLIYINKGILNTPLLTIPIQAKGMYVIKAGTQTLRVVSK